MFDLRDALGSDAECRFDPELHTGPDVFDDEPPAARTAREDVAREICASCPVQVACLEYALRVMPEYGVWAGLTSDEITELVGAYELGEVA